MPGKLEFVEQGPLYKGAEVVRFTALRPFAAPFVEVVHKLTCRIAVEAPPGVATVPLGEGFALIEARVKEALDWLAAALR